MPPHERAARFRSARLTRRVTGPNEQVVLSQMRLQPQTGRRVYELAADSRDVKAKVNDFAFAIVPENSSGLLDRGVAGVVRNTSLEQQMQTSLGPRYWHTLMEEILSVTISGLDRNQGFVAIDASSRFPTILDDLESLGLVSLGQDVILDPTYQDFLTKRLLAALQAVGNPPVARNAPNPLVRLATGQGGRGANQTAHTSTADFLWNVSAMAATSVVRNLAPIRPLLAAHDLDLNPTQWQAWEDALSYRARLIWGPPGTGKSRTVRAVVVGAALEGHQTNRPLRVLLSAFTYNAIDNVLLDIARNLAALIPGACDVFRLRSRYQGAPGNIAPTIDLELDKRNPSIAVRSLRTSLQTPDRQVVVGATPQQVHNLLTCDGGAALGEWFDLIVIDEASQMDVAHSILPLSAITAGGAVVSCRRSAPTAPDSPS